MKLARALIVAGMLLGAVSVAFSQTKPSTPQITTSAPSTGSLPESKMAVVYSDAFLDQKTGLARYNAIMNTVDKEFEARFNELKQIDQKLGQLQNEATALQKANPPNMQQIQAKADQFEALKKEGERKNEDFQNQYNKRKETALKPLQDDILKALETYAKSHNIAVIIDGSQVPLIFAADTLDITRAFINEFNTKNPVTAAVTTPR